MASSHDEQAVVVLVNCSGGGELDVVHDVLTRSLNTPTVLIKDTDLGSVSLSLDLGAGLLDVDGRHVRPVVAWVRHGSAGAIAAQSQPADSVKPVAAESWSGLFKQIAGLAAAIVPGNAPDGISQLMDADRLGVKVPRTVFTTDIAAGMRQLASGKVVVKTPDFRLFEPDRRNWSTYWPQILDCDADPSGRGVGAGVGRGPVVVQEYVAHIRELRVYHLDGGLCAFDVRKPEPSSPWTDPDSVTVGRIDCPDDAAKAVRTLCEAWGLRYGAFDLLVSPAGEPVFLEANADGDWLWYERKARWHGVSLMAAVMVREMFVRGTGVHDTGVHGTRVHGTA